MGKASVFISQLAKRLFPKNQQGFFLLFFIILLQFLNYLWRNNQDEFIMGEGLGLFFLLLALSPVILCLLIGVGVLVVSTIRYAFLKHGHVLPLAVLIIGSLISQFLPLLPSPAEIAFYTHSPDYEEVVDLARQNQLAHDDDCSNMFSVPMKYRSLIKDCIDVVKQPAFAIVFSPRTSHRFIAYAETYDALHNIGVCNGEDGAIFKKLKEHWYICTPAQD